MPQDRVMLLIDADNVSLDVVEQALPWVHKHFGGPHVRRAYCTAEAAVKHQEAFKALSIRPMVNLAAGKNSTDIALAVDAIDLTLAERPQVVVIASSDSDFAPLVSRLREKGCRVIGVGQHGKTGAETVGVYDDYEVFEHRPKAGTRPAPVRAAKKAPARKSPAKPAAADDAPPRKRAPRKKAGAAPMPPVDTAQAPPPTAPPPPPIVATAAARPVVAPPPPPPRPDRVREILARLPELLAGQRVELRIAAERLRDAGLLSKSGSSTKLFGQHADFFELTPQAQPNHVRWLGAD